MDSDERLFERLRGGDLSAFDELYARYERPLFGFLLASLRSRPDAEDAFHEAFMRALSSRDGHFEQGGVRAWLFRIARNVALNRLRSESRGGAARARLDPPEPPRPVPDELEERERSAALASAVGRLPAPLAELYRLRVSGLSYGEIAHVVEVPLGTVKSRMHEMVRQLREEMEPWTARG